MKAFDDFLKRKIIEKFNNVFAPQPAASEETKE